MPLFDVSDNKAFLMNIAQVILWELLLLAL